MSKNSIIKGTLVLTAAGFLTRIIGFFYRIILSKSLGEEKMGVYQLIFPVYSICFTLFASGIQTSISKLVAAQTGKYGDKDCNNIKRILRIGLTCSMAIALTLCAVVNLNADFIATRLLAEPSCANSLRILAFTFPFCGVTSCINGFYYGIKETTVPASTQLIEQITRVAFVMAFAMYIGGGDNMITCETAVLGLVAGEVSSNLFNVISMKLRTKKNKGNCINTPREPHIFREMMKLAVPLTSNRLLLSVLNSVESVLIPIMLRKAGYSASEALSIFGVLTGMAIPFIMFPSAIPNSFAVLLLPTISEAQAKGNEKLIGKTTAIAIKYCLMIGLLSTGVFIVFGMALGEKIYGSTLAGQFIVTLSWLCPFLYMTTTLGSIINGLGKAYITFINSVVGVSIRILCVIFVVPVYGIKGYLVGTLISQLIISTLDIVAVVRTIKFEPNLVDWLVKPGIIIVGLGYTFYEVYTRLICRFSSVMSNVLDIGILLSCAAVFCFLYIVILRMANLFNMKEFRQ